MIEIDREPAASIEASIAPLEGTLRPVLPEMPTVFGEAFRGRNRVAVKLSSALTRGPSYVKDSVVCLKYRKGRGGRGICPGCSSGTEDNHHGGSRCKKRGMSRFYQQKSQLIPSTGIGKLASISSG